MALVIWDAGLHAVSLESITPKFFSFSFFNNADYFCITKEIISVTFILLFLKHALIMFFHTFHTPNYKKAQIGEALSI